MSLKNQFKDLITVKIYGNKFFRSCCQHCFVVLCPGVVLVYIFSLKSVSELDLDSY